MQTKRKPASRPRAPKRLKFKRDPAFEECLRDASKAVKKRLAEEARGNDVLVGNLGLLRTIVR